MPSQDPTGFWIRSLGHRYAVIDRQLKGGLTQKLAERRLGGRPSILWQGAHIAEEIASTFEAVCAGPGARVLAPSVGRLAAREGEEPDPEFEDATLEEVREEIRSLGAELLEGLGSLGPADFEKPPLVPIHETFQGILSSRSQFIEGHLFHITYHAGAIGLLRAEWGL